MEEGELEKGLMFPILQKALETVHVDPAILSYIVEVVQRSREDHRVITGASPRASQSLFKTVRASAGLLFLRRVYELNWVDFWCFLHEVLLNFQIPTNNYGSLLIVEVGFIIQPCVITHSVSKH